MPALNEEAVAYLIHHMVLPPKLPQTDDSNASHGETLLNTTINALRKFEGILSVQQPELAEQVGSVASTITNLLSNRDAYGNVSETQLASLLRGLVDAPNGSIPLEIAAQNAALVISRESDVVVFQAFELSPTNASVMKTKGRLIRSFPTFACRVPLDRLVEKGLIEALAQAIAKMSSQAAPEFQPQTQKAGRNHSELRDTTHPGLVTDYLINVIAALGTPMDVFGLWKSTREDVLWSNAYQPWRRSPLWLLVRVTMQLQFARAAPNSLYKPFMVFFFSHILGLAKDHHDTIGNELLYIISAKLCRRMRKLEPFFATQPSFRAWKNVVDTTLKGAHNSMNIKWETIANDNGANIDTAILKTLKPSLDLDLDLQNLDRFIVDIASRKQQSNASVFRTTSKYPHYTAENIPSGFNGDAGYEAFQLAAAEKWVEDHLDSWLESFLDQESTCDKLFRFIEDYHFTASVAYSGIPLSTSIMYLCVLELWVACDKSACHIHPLLRDYDPEICLEPIVALSLPQQKHLQRLSEVERYVRLRREGAKFGRPSVMRDFGHAWSFAVKFFDQSAPHQALRSQIELDATAKRQQKCIELIDKQEQYKKLMKAYDKGTCQYREVVIDHYHGHKESRHDENCQRCKKRSEAEAIGIYVHEWPLASSDHKAKATVFELQIPVAFSHWRDATIYVAKNVLGLVQVSPRYPRAYYRLSNHQDLSVLHSNVPTQRIMPLSEIKPHIGTHRKVKSGVSFLTDADVCLESGLQYKYYDSSEKVFTGSLIPTDRISKHCTYTLPKRSSQLQHYVRPDAGSVSPNEVIATLSECPAHISLDEYKAFSSLPLGYRVQYMNVLTQLAMPTVDFARVETHCLILQTIHRAGPPSNDLSFHRASHGILAESAFGLALIHELEVALRRVTENWESWRALAIFVQLTLRLLSFASNDDVQSRCFEHLGSAREACMKWLDILNQRSQATTDNNQRTELHSRATEIALLCTSTLDVDEVHVQHILSTSSAVFALLRSSIIVQENMDSTKSEHGFLYRTMLQSWRSVMYRIFPTLMKGVLCREVLDGLNKAITASWAVFHATEDWVQVDQPWRQWLHVRYNALDVHFNLLTAELLVNGLPLARLPPKYLQHPLYASLFQKSSIEVMPTNEPGMELTAKHTYRDHDLSFGMEGPDMLVVAVHGAAKLDLIPSRMFEGRLPLAFIRDYIHWYNRGTNEIEFRPRTDPWLSTKTSWRLKKFGCSWRLENGPLTLVNIASSTGSTLAKIFSPLEQNVYIHTTFDIESQSVTIEMPRLQLGFCFENGKHLLYSRQYRGMVVDSDQRLGTLHGLYNKLVVKHRKEADERLVLVPEGSVSVCKTIDHVAVRIDRDTTVKVHAYQIDQILGRLTDTGSLQSKMYLAYLHALTSHCLPDLLTGHTGTEAGLSILRSAAVRSFSLLTEQNIAILGKIAKLSADRAYYPEGMQVMQVISWRSNLPSLSQCSGFSLAVDSIFQQAREMKFFYSSEEYVEPQSLGDMQRQLLERDMIRSSTFRVDGFGAEQFSTRFDQIYQPRAKVSSLDRGTRAFIAASLVLRDEKAMHSSIVASELKSLAFDILRGSPVQGPRSPLHPAAMRFDAKWLDEPSSFLPGMWCDLHLSLAKSSTSYNVFDVMMWLSTAAFAESAEMDIIQTLAAFYKLRELGSIEIPSFAQLSLSKGDKPDFASIQEHAHAPKLFEMCPESRLPKASTETYYQWQHRKQSAFQTKQNNATKAFARALEIQWPCEIPTKPVDQTAETYMDTDKAMKKIVPWYKALYDNRRFGEYLTNIGTTITRQRAIMVSVPQIKAMSPPKVLSGSERRWDFSVQDVFSLTGPRLCHDSTNRDRLCLPMAPKQLQLPSEERRTATRERDAQGRLVILCQNLEEKAKSPGEKAYISDLQKSCDSHAGRQSSSLIRTIPVDIDTNRRLEAHLADCQRYFKELNSLLESVVKSSQDIATTVQQSPRISATFWLQQLQKERYDTLSQDWKAVIIQYGLAVTEVHRAQRLLALSNHPQDLADEMRNYGHQNWDPAGFPETLLLEAESGIMVREVQEEIAQSMRNPPNNANSVMQLNMGEGKSSVIIPIVAAELADKKSLVRVIVAKPQSKQMLQMLVSKLGGLLNRRIYHLPFSRALKLDTAQANTIREIYRDCMMKRGVLLVQPEHILSFKLMGIERLIDDNVTIGQSLLRTQQFFDTASRDLVDESDENFSVKFELVYTMGSQKPVELSPERWNIIQSMMELVARYASRVKDDLPDSIEYDNRWEDRYPRIRTLNSTGEDKLLDLVAGHICDVSFPGLPISRQPQSLRDAVLRYIRHSDLTTNDIETVEKGTFWKESTRDALMLVRGLIAGGVLRFALGSKRWRVNYGIDPNRSPKTKLAVPYRSKDSPSLRSEFSHPDVILVLTSLTYYYGGLEDEDLFDAFAHLLKSDQAEIEYEQWVRTAGSLPETFRYSVNIEDRYQCVNQIFPSLRYSKGAIDYFLSHIVFPKEMKEFPYKLSASGWDIGQVKPLPLTGFSGTNDSRHVLPLDVHHLDLPDQQHTNALVLAHLLQEENSVELLPPRTAAVGSDAEQLLAIVNAMGMQTRVILDVGAQILELNNMQVAEKWLSTSDTKTTRAVVFFDEHEELSVLDRTGKVESLQTSPFAKQLDVCVVYLDEAHTRGTDLKLPRDYRAAVTLGANLTKDRLVQACMRMRKLGRGQSVVFCIPLEIQTKILQCTAKPSTHDIGVSDVLAWAISETWADMRRSMPLWASQGHRFETHKDLLNGVNTAQEQARGFLEVEAQSIDSRYRPRQRIQDEAFKDEGWDVSNENIAKILACCRKFDTMNFTSATLQEEQERELSPEVEEERQVQRPASMVPENHELHDDLVRLVKTGVFVAKSEAFIPAFEALRSTSAASFFNVTRLPKDLLVTADYARTVKPPSGLPPGSYISDSYQRPVQWILSVPRKAKSPKVMQPICKLVVLSPFEADRLLEKIRKAAKVTLHLYAPRPNLAYDPLDKLHLYTVGRPFDPTSIPRSLILQLNLFAGQLYFNSYDEYVELCQYLGLAWAAATEGEVIDADGFIKQSTGRWGLDNSPVKFLKDMVTKVRRDGESAAKTHLGKMLDGALLEEVDFK